MRKLLYVIITTVFIATLQGCGNSQSSSRDEKSNNSSYTVNKETQTPTAITISPTILQTIPPVVTPIITTNPIPTITPSSQAKSTFAKESKVTFDERIKVLLEQKAKNIIENPTIELIDGYKIINIATGDLNSDGHSDLAVVAEKLSENQQGSRMLYVLMQNADNSYLVKYANQHIILGRGEGGIWGDPFQKIEINNDTLIINEYGGSNFRWGFNDQFKYIGSEFMLVHSKRAYLYTGTGNGYDKDYDYINKTLKYTSTSHVIKDYKPILIYTDKLSSDKYLFDSFDLEKYQSAIDNDFLPSLGWYRYDKYDKMLDLKISTNKALDLIKNTFNPDFEKVQIPWTSETKANYSSLIFYTVPDYYYKKGDSELCYYNLEDMVKGKLKHTILLKDKNNKTTCYSIDDLTGEVKKEY